MAADVLHFIEVDQTKEWGNKWSQADPSTSTLWTLFEAVTRGKRSECPALGHRTCNSRGRYSSYRWVTYSELAGRVHHFGSALAAMSIRPTERCCIIADNSPEWITAEFGMHRQSVVPVPLCPSSTSSMIAHSIRKTRPSGIVCSGSVLGKVFEALEAVGPSQDGSSLMRLLIVYGDLQVIDVEQRQRADRMGICLLDFADFLLEGKRADLPPTPPSPTSCFSIVFTSGTAGDSKGVILTHWAVVNQIETLLNWPAFDNPENETHLSYMPLCHIFERVTVLAILRNGGKVGFGCGNVERLWDDISLLKPTFLIGVPRTFIHLQKRIYDKVQTSGTVKSTVFNMAIKAKNKALQSGGRTLINWDWLVFSKVKSMLGGNLKCFICSGAKLADDLAGWLSDVFSIPVYQVYGMTELCGAITVSFKDTHRNTVGFPLPKVQVRLVDVPETEYYARGAPPCGEIWVNSPSIFGGYIQDEKSTIAMLPERGWLATGDIGRLNQNGTITIIDRTKTALKLCTGQYIPAEMLENLMESKLPWVEQAWVHTDVSSERVIAVVVPRAEAITAIAKDQLGISTSADRLHELFHNPKVQEFAKNQVDELGKTEKLNDYEIPSVVLLETDHFGVENGLMSLTMKLRRDNLQQRFAARITQAISRLKAGPLPGEKVYEFVEPN